MKKQLLLFVAILLPMLAGAHDIAVQNGDGVTIYYNYINNGTELAVTFQGSDYAHSVKYTGDIVIPEEVIYMNRTRKVTSIGDYAFYNCSSLTSVTIPNSVTNICNHAFEWCSDLTSIEISNYVTTIGDNAFYACAKLTSVTIGSCVTSIGDNAFAYCSGLTSIIIPNSVTSIGGNAFRACSGLTSIIIPSSVTSIGGNAFKNCSGLTFLAIGSSVTSIGGNAFENCSGLKKVIVSDIAAWCGIIFSGYYANPLTYARHLYSDENTEIKDLVIPNDVTSIGNYAFYGCSGLTSIVIPNSVTSIGNSTFLGCSGLTSITIPNSVTIIGNYAFYNCSGLTSITIPNSVTSIGSGAFNGVDMPTVISLIENPFTIAGKSTTYDGTFSQNTFNNATLYVPVGTIDKYKATNGWKDFFFIEESGTPPTPPTPEKCEKPTIGYVNGKLTFASSTEGATCYYSITDSDIKSGSGSEVQLGVTYNISVYAAKVGCENSATATATLCWIDVEPKTEGINNGIAQVPAKAVLIQAVGGAINVQGCDDGERIGIYSINGSQVGTAVSQNGAATVNTTLQPGSVAIIKVGKKSVKIVVK